MKILTKGVFTVNGYKQTRAKRSSRSVLVLALSKTPEPTTDRTTDNPVNPTPGLLL